MERKLSNKKLFTGIAVATAVLVVGIGGFAGGVGYQKSHAKSTTLTRSDGSSPAGFQSSNGGPSFSSGARAMGGGTIGTVTAISSGSITVKNSRSGESTTYAIVGTTQITKDNTIASVSDITTDSTVRVTPDSANTSNALSITVNPELGGFSGGPQSSTIQTN